MERYEQLRALALTGQSEGWRMGLALLERSGVAAWARAWRATAPAARASADPRAGIRAAAEGGAEERHLVDVLAAMALACAGAR